MDAPSTEARSWSQSRQMALTLPVFVGTIFLSAFLLFGIQPMFAKLVLPKLGGSPGVWSVAMVFFQSVLLAGYAYAHWLASRFSVRRAALVHLAVMIVVLLAALPITIASGFDRPPQQGEVFWLLALFAASVGLPFFVVSANGPLLQAWFARSGHAHAADPYFLYAASNIGSFIALLAYPFAIEPFLRLSTQTSAWSWGFALLIAGVTACAGLALGRSPAGDIAAKPLPVASIPASRKLAWLALAFVPSGLLVAVTAHISTDVASAPLLWVAPLALFLLTFAIVFQRRPVLRHGWMLHAHLAVVAVLILSLVVPYKPNWAVQILLHLALFFTTAMVAHGELARRRPDAGNLTAFYLWMSLGGVLGGLFSGLLAPLIFNSVVEYPLLIIAGMVCRPSFTKIALSRQTRLILAGIAFAGFCGLVVSEARRTDSIRSFFGVTRILEVDDGQMRLLVHGTTIHGAQRLRDEKGALLTGRPEPLTYYFSGGAIADGVEAARRARGGKLGAVAAIGLGTGSLACQTRPGEAWTYYEIDREIIRIATDPARFGFFAACQPDPKIVLGDARLTIADTADGSLDLIIVDAFSSDSVPVHLLTMEAMDLYWRKLKPDGALLMHVSNRNMEIGSVVAAAAAARGLTSWIRGGDAPLLDKNEWRIPPHVALVARRPADMPALADDARWVRQTGVPITTPWTDDYADIIGAIRRQLSR